jgi:hypothetical protein
MLLARAVVAYLTRILMQHPTDKVDKLKISTESKRNDRRE